MRTRETVITTVIRGFAEFGASFELSSEEHYWQDMGTELPHRLLTLKGNP